MKHLKWSILAALLVSGSVGACRSESDPSFTPPPRPASSGGVGTTGGDSCDPAPCEPEGAGCSFDSQRCESSCHEGTCDSDTCSPEGEGCSSDGQCCAGSCHQGVCEQECSESGVCANWLQFGSPYSTLCGDAQQAADTVLACLCAPCSDVCGGASCMTDLRSLTAGEECIDCIDALADCTAERDDCMTY